MYYLLVVVVVGHVVAEHSVINVLDELLDFRSLLLLLSLFVVVGDLLLLAEAAAEHELEHLQERILEEQRQNDDHQQQVEWQRADGLARDHFDLLPVGVGEVQPAQFDQRANGDHAPQELLQVGDRLAATHALLGVDVEEQRVALDPGAPDDVADQDEQDEVVGGVVDGVVDVLWLALDLDQ